MAIGRQYLFPKVCCCCLQPCSRTERRPYSLGSDKYFVPLPWCIACYRRRWLWWILVGVSIATFTGFLLLILPLFGIVDGLEGPIPIIGGFVLGIVAVVCLGDFVPALRKAGHSRRCDAVPYVGPASGAGEGWVQVSVRNPPFAAMWREVNPTPEP
jgi:hypothetical protein